jgi:hypothetical protein
MSTAIAMHAARRAPQLAAAAGAELSHSAAEAAAAVVAAAAVALPGGIAGVCVTEAAHALEAVLAAADMAVTDHELSARWRAHMSPELLDADGSDSNVFTNQVCTPPVQLDLAPDVTDCHGS